MRCRLVSGPPAAGPFFFAPQMRNQILNRALKFRPIVPMGWGMNVSGQSATSLLDSVLNAQTTRVDMGVAVLKKAQDLDKQEGAAMIQMLEQASIRPGENGQLLDTYA